MLDILKWKEPTISYYTLVIIGVIMYTLIFHLDKIFSEKYVKKIHNFSEECLVGCKNEKTCNRVNSLRSEGYYLFDNDENQRCIITKWEISHFFTHIFLGYFTNFYISFATSIGFELYEHYFHNCGSILDLVYNMSGFLVGNYFKHVKT